MVTDTVENDDVDYMTAIVELTSTESAQYTTSNSKSKPQSKSTNKKVASNPEDSFANSVDLQLELESLHFDDVNNHKSSHAVQKVDLTSIPQFKDQNREVLGTENFRVNTDALSPNARNLPTYFKETSNGVNLGDRKVLASFESDHYQVGAVHVRGIGVTDTSFSEHSDGNRSHLSLDREDDFTHDKQLDQININGNIEDFVGGTGLVTAYVVEDIDPKAAEEEKKQQEAEKQKELRNLRRKGVILTCTFVVIVVIVSTTLGLLLRQKNDKTETTPQFRSFKTKEELYQAVDFYINSIDPSNTIIAELYGYPIGTWDVSQLTEFDRVFDSNARDATFSFQNINSSSTFNEDISDWNVSGATSMFGMFASSVRFNQDLSKWDVSRVTNMSNMFVQCRSFNQDLTAWDVSKVTTMSFMFYNASFNGNISSWNTERVTDMSFMFGWSDFLGNTTRFTSWNTSSVTNMKAMFRHGHMFDSPDLSRWDVSRVQTMSLMFSFADVFNGSDISGWDVSNVQDMSEMFNNALAFDQDLTNWNVSSVTKLDGAFSNATSFDNNLCKWANLIPDDVNLTNIFVGSACKANSEPVLHSMFTSWCDICTF